MSRRRSVIFGLPVPIRTVELYPIVATRARNLIREGVPRGWTGLEGARRDSSRDRQAMDVAEFHTYDERLGRYAEVIGFPICEPRSEQPRIV